MTPCWVRDQEYGTTLKIAGDRAEANLVAAPTSAVLATLAAAIALADQQNAWALDFGQPYPSIPV